MKPGVNTLYTFQHHEDNAKNYGNNQYNIKGSSGFGISFINDFMQQVSPPLSLLSFVFQGSLF